MCIRAQALSACQPQSFKHDVRLISAANEDGSSRIGDPSELPDIHRCNHARALRHSTSGWAPGIMLGNAAQGTKASGFAVLLRHAVGKSLSCAHDVDSRVEQDSQGSASAGNGAVLPRASPRRRKSGQGGHSHPQGRDAMRLQGCERMGARTVARIRLVLQQQAGSWDRPQDARPHPQHLQHPPPQLAPLQARPSCQRSGCSLYSMWIQRSPVKDVQLHRV